MPENEFERNVRDKMDELNMRPSDAVWKGVEYELKKKKRRRVIFFISLLAGLSLAGWFSYTMISNNSDSRLTNTNNSINNNTNTNNKNSISDSIQVISPTPEISVAKEQSSTKGDQQNEKKAIVVQKEQALKNNKEENSNIEKGIKQETKPGKKTKKLVIKRKGNAVKEITDHEQKITPEKNDNIKAVEQKNEKKEPVKEKEAIKDIARSDVEAEKIKEERNVPDSSSQLIVTADSTAKVDSAIATIIPVENKEQDNIAKKKSSSKIKWGVEFSGGVTSNRENAFSLSTDKSLYDASSGYNSPGTGTGSSGAPPITRPPSSIYSGPAFKIGLLVERKLSERSGLSAGLRYSFMSEKLKIGSRYYALGNSSQFATNRIYLSTQEKEYHNNYHFIEIPLTYQLRLNKGSNTGIIWNGGISAGYLISTNSLIYDSLAGGIYYRDKQAFNKFHFSFATGFALRFGEKRKLQWTIGPDLLLDMTRLMKQDAYIQKRYLLYGGLTGRLIFSSGKK